jgi:hypothetical protein
MPLQKLNLEICHYNFSIPLHIPLWSLPNNILPIILPYILVFIIFTYGSIIETRFSEHHLSCPLYLGCSEVHQDPCQYFFPLTNHFSFLYLSHHTIFESKTLQFTETFEIECGENTLVFL